MDTAQWPQEIVVKPMEDIVVLPNSTPTTTLSSKQHHQQQSSNLERKLVRPQKEQAVNCPRCNSTNTKFCYYNNYSLSQPRYFCKTCRRYWTEGGSLRNIPVGGGSRKNKRSSSSSTSSSISSTTSTSNSSSSTTSSSFLVSASSSKKQHQQQLLPDLILPPISHHFHHLQNPNHHHDNHGIHGQDLNLGFSPTTAPHPHPPHHHDFKTFTELIQVPNFDINGNKDIITNSTSAATTTSTTSSCHLSALELLTGITNPARGLNSFLPMPGSVFPASSGMFLPEFKPSSLSFSLDGLGISNGGGGGGGGGYGSSSLHSNNHVQESSSNGRLLFPFEDLKQVSTPTSAEHNTGEEDRDQHGGDSTGYWTGILGGGGGGGGVGGGGGAW